jgi:hypothetical protein
MRRTVHGSVVRQARVARRRRAIDVYVIGGGGQARETFQLVELTRGLRFRGFLVEQKYRDSWGRTITGGKILGPPSLLKEREGIYYVGIGDGASRDRLIRELDETRLGPPLIAPDVAVHPSNEVGKGALICRGATLTVDVCLAAGAIVNCGATIIEKLTVADDVLIGAGAVVIRDLTRRGTYAGVPARLLHR